MVKVKVTRLITIDCLTFFLMQTLFIDWCLSYLVDSLIGPLISCGVWVSLRLRSLMWKVIFKIFIYWLIYIEINWYIYIYIYIQVWGAPKAILALLLPVFLLIYQNWNYFVIYWWIWFIRVLNNFQSNSEYVLDIWRKFVISINVLKTFDHKIKLRLASGGFRNQSCML
jgi:hypothetical protein